MSEITGIDVIIYGIVIIGLLIILVVVLPAIFIMPLGLLL
jgi:hypothetical protein